MDDTEIKDLVREHYAELARKALAGTNSGCGCASTTASSCCGPSDVIPVEALGPHVPQEVANTSFGCGTPLEIARLQPGEVVVDLGSGGGLDCFLASQRVGPTGRVIGVDMTPDMLALANANAKKVGATNVEFRKGFLEDLPVDDASVDVIISNCVINLSPDKDRTFREAFRVLKPGGRVAISDVVTRTAMPEAFRANMTNWAECVSGAIPEQEYIDKMHRAGFTDVRKVSGGENPLENVYSARIIGVKPSLG